MNIDLLFLVTRSDTVGGVQIHIQDLCMNLMKDGYSVKVIVGANSYKNPFILRLIEKKIPFDVCQNLENKISFKKDLQVLFYLFKYLRKRKPKLVSIHSSKAGILGRLACFLSSTPCLFTAHGWSFNSKTYSFSSKIYTLLEFFTQFIPRKIITVSEFDRLSAIKRNIKKEKIITIYNSVPDIPFINNYETSPNLEINSKPVVRLLNVARFDFQKDQLSLLNALSEIETDNNWHLDFVGDGPLIQKYKAISCDLNIDKNVTFHGYISNTLKFYQEADIFVLMSHWEGFPRSTVEALRSSLPVIVSNVGGSSEAVIDNINGFVIPESNVLYLRKCLKILIDDCRLRNSMSKISRKIFQKNFSYKNFYSKMLNVYKENILP